MKRALSPATIVRDIKASLPERLHGPAAIATLRMIEPPRMVSAGVRHAVAPSSPRRQGTLRGPGGPPTAFPRLGPGRGAGSWEGRSAPTAVSRLGPGPPSASDGASSSSPTLSPRGAHPKGLDDSA